MSDDSADPGKPGSGARIASRSVRRLALPPHPRTAARRAQDMFLGAGLLTLTWIAAAELGAADLPGFRGPNTTWIMAVAGAVLGAVGLLLLLQVGSALVLLLYFVVSYTPLADSLTRPLELRDPDPHADAVVPLSSEVETGGLLNVEGEERLQTALELLKDGRAKHLVITRLPPPSPSPSADISRQLAEFGLPLRFNWVGPVGNTHDEARDVARLEEAQHWKSVIVVTSPLHSRRAVGAFRKAGVETFSFPAIERRYNVQDLKYPRQRRDAFSDWFREWLGGMEYRARGWE